jgi:hypothetical protein
LGLLENKFAILKAGQKCLNKNSTHFILGIVLFLINRRGRNFGVLGYVRIKRIRFGIFKRIFINLRELLHNGQQVLDFLFGPSTFMQKPFLFVVFHMQLLLQTVVPVPEIGQFGVLASALAFLG